MSIGDEVVGERRTGAGGDRCRVRVWFGEHPIADYTAAPDLATRYAAAIQRRFSGLRVTVDGPTGNGPPLPTEQWWDRAPR